MADERDEFADAVGAAMNDQDRSLDPLLERYAMGKLSAAELAGLEARAKNDPNLATALELHAPLSPELKARMARENMPKKKVIPLYSWTARFGALAAGIVGLVLWLGQPDPQIRSKSGDELHLSCWAPGAAKPVRCESGDQVVAHTGVMFHLDLGGDRHVMMFGQDDRSPWTRYFPSRGGASELVEKEERDFLGASLELDDTPGVEHFVIFVGAEEFAESEAKAALADPAKRSKAWEIFEVKLHKR